MKHIALVVGINEYQNIGGLTFCVPDAAAMAAAFAGRGIEVKQLLDDDATKAGILGELHQLATELAAGDRVIFYYSGHGAGYFPATDSHPDVVGLVSAAPAATDPEDLADEGFDEFLCPVDMVLGPDGPASMIRDDELRAALAPFSTKGVEVVMIADCCHSGTANMGPHPHDTPRRLDPEEQKALFAGYQPAPRTEEIFGLQHPVPNQLLIAGCQDTQLSWESAAVGHGYMTHFLLEALHKGEAHSYQALFDAVAPVVADAVFTANGVNQDMNLVDGFDQDVKI